MIFEDIIAFNNLCAAWEEFVRGKRHKKDVAEFSLNLSANLYALHEDLKNKVYEHGAYHAFNISDPKQRSIHKATVRDRVLHHAVYRILYPCFDGKFICDVYSCRNGKGVHRALRRFARFGGEVSKNDTRTCWVLKCDIRKFFASIDRATLVRILERHIHDRDTLWLLGRIIGSFENTPGRGLPLGNLTSQLLVNVYMDEFDQFVKHTLKAKHYLRYADDFAILSNNRKWLEAILPEMHDFLHERLKLSLHPDKTFIKTLSSGVDVLGWVHFPDHRVLRTTTKRRALKRVAADPQPERVASYLGMLTHGNAQGIRGAILGLAGGGSWADEA